MARRYEDESMDREDDWERQRARNERRFRSDHGASDPSIYETGDRYGYGGSSTPRRGYYSQQVAGRPSYPDTGWERNRIWTEPQPAREESRWIELRPGYDPPPYSPYTPVSRHETTLRGGFAGKGPRGYVRSDERIREDVNDRLSWDDQVDASDITVTVSEGEVTLEGTVPDRMSKRHAEDVTEGVLGVKDVHNRLKASKGVIQEVGDKLMGREPEHHGHAGSGTRNQPANGTLPHAQHNR